MAGKLNDSQLTILTAAAARDITAFLPLPKLKAPAVAVQKMISKLLTDGLLETIPAEPDDEVWEHADGSNKTALIITSTGLAAIGILGETVVSGNKRPIRRKKVGRGAKARQAGRSGAYGRVEAGHGDRAFATGTGASIEEMMTATGWQAHSVCGFMSGALKKRLGLDSKTGERRYYVAAVRNT